MEKKTRELNYDILRTVACIAVILIHISAIYYYSIYDSSYFGQTYDSNSFIIVILNQYIYYNVYMKKIFMYHMDI